MADQAHNRQGFYPINPDADVEWLPVRTAQTLAKGDAVIIDTGQVQIALAASAILLGVIAENAVTLTAGVLVPCWIDPAITFQGVADADGSSLVLGGEIDIIGATGAMMLDASASATDVFKLLRVDDGQAVATARAFWRFRLNKAVFAQID